LRLNQFPKVAGLKGNVSFFWAVLKRFYLGKKSRKDDQFKISIAFQDTRLRELLLKVCLRVSVEFLNYNTKGSPINYDDVMSGLSF